MDTSRLSISDEQRRETAARLREYDVAEFKESAIVPFLECLGHGYKDWRGILDELAELIDRPTCKPVISNEMEGCVFCSNCGAEIGEYGVPNYCHNCGAGLVE